MEELKVHIRHVMLWKFKNKKNTTEAAKKIYSVYSLSVIIDRHVQKWFSKFHSCDRLLKDAPDENTHQTSIKMLSEN